MPSMVTVCVSALASAGNASSASAQNAVRIVIGQLRLQVLGVLEVLHERRPHLFDQAFSSAFFADGISVLSTASRTAWW